MVLGSEPRGPPERGVAGAEASTYGLYAIGDAINGDFPGHFGDFEGAGERGDRVRRRGGKEAKRELSIFKTEQMFRTGTSMNTDT